MKKLIAILPLILALVSEGQSFFKPEKPPTQSQKATISATQTLTQNVIRPIANIASYAVPNNLGLSGVGISWQHQEWNETDQRWKVLYSLNALTWYSTTQTVYYGIAAGALNNLILVGIATNDGRYFIGTIGIGININ